MFLGCGGHIVLCLVVGPEVWCGVCFETDHVRPVVASLNETVERLHNILLVHLYVFAISGSSVCSSAISQEGRVCYCSGCDMG